MNKKKRAEFFDRLRSANPAPTTELKYGSTYELLVSVILSAQATDVSVNQATAALFKTARTPETIVKLGTHGLKKYIRSIGLFNSKARNIIATSRILLRDHDGRVPETREALETLPGVGRKTANVVLNTAFGQPTIAVDTHIFRVCNRTRLAPGSTPLKVEQALNSNVPEEFRQHAHHWLILHGRYVCKARKPECPDCPVEDLCEYGGKTTVETEG